MIKTCHVASILFLALVLIPTGAGAQADPPPPQAGESSEAAPSEESKPPADPQMARMMAFQESLQAIHSEANASNLLAQVQICRQLVADFGNDPNFAQLAASFLSWKLSAVGRYGEAHEAFDAGSPVELPTPDEAAAQRVSVKGFEPTDALTAVVQASVDKRAVFINEGHHVPQHRAFTWRLLPLLREQGFTHFAAETLNEIDQDLQERGYPAQRTGVYTDETLYADLVRTALRLGFQVIAYEARVRTSEEREPGQARNLIDRVFKEDPDARLLVHVGYRHNRESADAYEGAGAMAFHFQSMTGIDPLTIDQTELTERSDPAYEHPLYQELCGASEERDAVAFKNRQGELWSLPGSDRDITICQPRSHLERGRPTWLGLGGARRAVPLPEDVCGRTRPCLVEARSTDEGPDAIPVDRLEVRADEPVTLMLPEGTFTVDVLDGDGAKIRSMTKTIGETETVRGSAQSP